MEFKQLKNLVQKLGGLLVLDGDEPAFVVLSYDRYQKMDLGQEIPLSGGNGLNTSNPVDMSPEHLAKPNVLGFDSGNDDENTMEKLNQEILALKEEIRQREETELMENAQTAEPIAEVVDLD